MIEGALGIDGLALVAAQLGQSDVLAFALTCTAFRAAQKAARLALVTKSREVHHRSQALHLWAKRLGCPLPKMPSDVFQGLHLSRGYKHAQVWDDDEDELIDLSAETYDCVAFAHGAIAFRVECFDESEEEPYGCFDQTRVSHVYHQRKGFFTVRDLCDAFADSEKAYGAEAEDTNFEGLGPSGSVEVAASELETRLPPPTTRLERELRKLDNNGARARTRQVPVFKAYWSCGCCQGGCC